MLWYNNFVKLTYKKYLSGDVTMKKQHQSNLLPQELKNFEVLKESKLEQVTGGNQKAAYATQRSFVPSWFRRILRN